MVRQDGSLRVFKTNRRTPSKQIVQQLHEQVSDVQHSLAANYHWDLYHMDLKTAFLQGEAYDEN